MIDYMDLTLAGYELRETALKTKIPYTDGGHTLDGMDCAGMCEYLLMQCGMAKDEVRLRSSNQHWRKSLKWRGTTEECVKLFGEIPEGAWNFIVSPIPHKNYPDKEGNATHMGQYLDYGLGIHASESKEQVLESKMPGKAINGGWNAIGLPKWVRYSDKVEEILQGTGGVEYGGEEEPPQAEPVIQALPTYVRVQTANGAGVRARQKASPKAIYKYTVPENTLLEVLGDSGQYWKVHYLGKGRYVDKRFVVQEVRT